MKALTYFFTWFIILAAGSCKKEKLPEITAASPVFTFSAAIEGTAVSLAAGKDDYYLYSSVAADQNGVKNYTALLTTQNCNSECANSLKIIFLEHKINSTDEDSSLHIGNYNFASENGTSSSYSVQFTKTSVGPVNTGVLWDFGDGSSEFELNPTHLYKKPGNYDVCMEASFQGGCSSNLCNPIRLGNSGPFCEAAININSIVGTTVNLIGNAAAGTPPYTYSWDFGDGNFGNEQNMVHTYTQEGAYTVTLTVTDANGINEIKRQNLRTQNSSDCTARYNYTITGIPNPLNLGTVIVQWTDQNGLTYTSKNNNQPLSSLFTVKSVEDYQANENGQNTKKLEVEFSCILYNGNNQIEIKNASAVIAVAY